MSIETVTFRDQVYPALQSKGFASKFAFPFAYQILKGVGFDIGYSRKEWMLPGSIGIEPSINPEFDDMHLPSINVDYIFSSHCLEHVPGRFQDTIEYWLTKVKKGGVILLYLPNCDYQKYWAWGNNKHTHYLSPQIMKDYLIHLDGIESFIVTDGYDLNGSFYVVINK